MDATLAWANLVSACEEGDMATAHDQAMDLADWLDMGGCRPRCIPTYLDQLTLRHFALGCLVVSQADQDGD